MEEELNLKQALNQLWDFIQEGYSYFDNQVDNSEETYLEKCIRIVVNKITALEDMLENDIENFDMIVKNSTGVNEMGKWVAHGQGLEARFLLNYLRKD